MLRSRKYHTEDIPIENSSERKVRLFLAVMFFIQVLLTPTPFMHNVVSDTELQSITAIQFIVQADGFLANSVQLGLYGLALVLFPLTAFFFCVLDKRSRVKYIFTGACSVLCAVLIVFGIGKNNISIGAVFTLIINVVTLFMTSQGVQATSARIAQSKKP